MLNCQFRPNGLKMNKALLFYMKLYIRGIYMYICDINVLSKCIDVKNHQIHQYLTFKIFYIGEMLMRDGTNTQLQTRGGCIF